MAAMRAIEQRGGLGGIALTHDHADHAEAVRGCSSAFRRRWLPGAGESTWSSWTARVRSLHGDRRPRTRARPLRAARRGGLLHGDAVLGSGWVFISPHPGALSGYLSALDRLRRREDFDVICPGHGPPVWDPRAKLDEYITHRTDRENRLMMALKAGRRTVDELLDDVWSDVPAGFARPQR